MDGDRNIAPRMGYVAQRINTQPRLYVPIKIQGRFHHRRYCHTNPNESSPKPKRPKRIFAAQLSGAMDGDRNIAPKINYVAQP
jgi:hypothetical protein